MNSSAFIALTGNGLMLAEDLVRRFVMVELDPRTEDPEARPFKVDIRALCHDRRRELLVALLTIWRWGRLQSNLPKGLASGSFETWSAWARDPLLALGCQDPMARISETKERDTGRQAIREVFEAWWACHGDRPMAARELADDVRGLLDPLNRGRQYVAARLENLSKTRMAGFVFCRQAAPGKHGTAVYALQRTSEPDKQDGPWTADAPQSPNAPDADRRRKAAGGGAEASVERESVRGGERHRGHRGNKRAAASHAPYAPDAIPGREVVSREAAVASPHLECGRESEGHREHGGHTVVDGTSVNSQAHPAHTTQPGTWRTQL